MTSPQAEAVRSTLLPSSSAPWRRLAPCLPWRTPQSPTLPRQARQARHLLPLQCLQAAHLHHHPCLPAVPHLRHLCLLGACHHLRPCPPAQALLRHLRCLRVLLRVCRIAAACWSRSRRARASGRHRLRIAVRRPRRDGSCKCEQILWCR